MSDTVDTAKLIDRVRKLLALANNKAGKAEGQKVGLDMQVGADERRGIK